MMSTLDTALFWLSQGVATVPLVYRSKQPAVKWTPYRTRLPSYDEVLEWYQERRNIALVTSWQNLVILDFDTLENYAQWLVWQLERQRDITETYRVQSNRGVHVYYYLTEPINLRSIIGAPFEIKCAGKLCTIPPSIHESGRKYTSLDDPARIRVVTPEQVLTYSPVEFAPIVFPLAQRSKFAPVDTDFNDAVPDILKIPLLRFFTTATKIDDRFYRSNCPFHGHKNNFWIDTQLNIGGCFAGCGRFDVIDFYARRGGLDKKSAIIELRRML